MIWIVALIVLVWYAGPEATWYTIKLPFRLLWQPFKLVGMMFSSKPVEATPEPPHVFRPEDSEDPIYDEYDPINNW